jgi:hypothetical protein
MLTYADVEARKTGRKKRREEEREEEQRAALVKSVYTCIVSSVCERCVCVRERERRSARRSSVRH